MRWFIQSKDGYLAGCDYSSQEFLIAALLSDDEAMIDAYRSGDVYLAFAKQAGLVPADATKDSHKRERDLCKALVLGISYDMSASGLAPRLSAASGKAYSPDDAQNLIDVFFDAYPDYDEWKSRIGSQYRRECELSLPDGWTMWGDNDNYRSVGNFPIQGHGAVVMREAVRLCYVHKLTVVFTLHDALYIESTDPADILKLRACMHKAFINVMQHQSAGLIRIDGQAWGKGDFSDIKNKFPGKLATSEYYLDDKSESDIQRYSRYFGGTK
jgi:hypothetical protein